MKAPRIGSECSMGLDRRNFGDLEEGNGFGPAYFCSTVTLTIFPVKALGGPGL